MTTQYWNEPKVKLAFEMKNSLSVIMMQLTIGQDRELSLNSDTYTSLNKFVISKIGYDHRGCLR